jgi:hypothetical protein
MGSLDKRYKLKKPYDVSRYLIKSVFLKDEPFGYGLYDWSNDVLKPRLEEISLTRLEGNPLKIDEVDYINLEGPVKDPDYNVESFYIETFGKDDNVDPNQDALIVFAVDAKTGEIYAIDVDTEFFG